jgi:hypothetical protein
MFQIRSRPFTALTLAILLGTGAGYEDMRYRHFVNIDITPIVPGKEPGVMHSCFDGLYAGRMTELTGKKRNVLFTLEYSGSLATIHYANGTTFIIDTTKDAPHDWAVSVKKPDSGETLAIPSDEAHDYLRAGVITDFALWRQLCARGLQIVRLNQAADENDAARQVLGEERAYAYGDILVLKHEKPSLIRFFMRHFKSLQK